MALRIQHWFFERRKKTKKYLAVPKLIPTPILQGSPKTCSRPECSFNGFIAY